MSALIRRLWHKIPFNGLEPNRTSLFILLIIIIRSFRLQIFKTSLKFITPTDYRIKQRECKGLWLIWLWCEHVKILSFDIQRFLFGYNLTTTSIRYYITNMYKQWHTKKWKIPCKQYTTGFAVWYKIVVGHSYYGPWLDFACQLEPG